VDAEAKSKPRETPARQALRMETRGLILLAAIILAVYLFRYFHLVHRSTP
jgi:hypothetical protein